MMKGKRFFFSSRRRHTRSYGDWSSDVCSSDLGLGDGVAVPGVRLPADAITFENRRVDVRGVAGQPAEERRADVKADAGIGVHDAHDAVGVVQDARGGVACVALRRYALIPIVVGSGGIL